MKRAPGESTSDAVVRLTVRVKPRAKRSGILRAEGLALDVSLTAPPVDGAANDELIAVIARALRVPKRSLALVLGHTSKTKVVEVIGLDPAEIAQRLGQ